MPKTKDPVNSVEKQLSALATSAAHRIVRRLAREWIDKTRTESHVISIFAAHRVPGVRDRLARLYKRNTTLFNSKSAFHRKFAKRLHPLLEARFAEFRNFDANVVVKRFEERYFAIVIYPFTKLERKIARCTQEYARASYSPRSLSYASSHYSSPSYDSTANICAAAAASATCDGGAGHCG